MGGDASPPTRGVDMIKQKSTVERDGSIQGAMENALLVARDFLKLVSVFGMDVHGTVMPSDRRYRVFRNGSYYEVAGYCFTYGYMYGTDEVHWTFVDFDATVIYRNRKMTLGEAYFWYVREEGIIIR